MSTRATLPPVLRLPPELRQQILSHVLSFDNLGTTTQSTLSSISLTLSLVHPLLNLDMTPVLSHWRRLLPLARAARKAERGILDALLDDRMTRLEKQRTLLRSDAALPSVGARKRRKGSVLYVKQETRKRSLKCWRCGERHYWKSRTCPWKLRANVPWWNDGVEKKGQKKGERTVTGESRIIRFDE